MSRYVGSNPTLSAMFAPKPPRKMPQRLVGALFWGLRDVRELHAEAPTGVRVSYRSCRLLGEREQAPVAVEPHHTHLLSP